MTPHLMLLASLCSTVPATGTAPAASTTLLALIDTSASVGAPAAYRPSAIAIVRDMKPGDRVIVATITDKTYTRFKTLIDCVLPVSDWTADNPLLYRRKLEGAYKELESAIDAVFAEPRVTETAIMDGVLADSGPYDFARHSPTAATTARIISDKRKAGELPDLGGARVFVLGATGSSTRQARAVEQFWRAFLRESQSASVTYGVPVQTVR
jgi:hypothetical protein